VYEVSEYSQRARAMKKADAITYLSELLEDEQRLNWWRSRGVRHEIEAASGCGVKITFVEVVVG